MLGKIFGATSQVVVGIVATAIGITAWIYWGWMTKPTVTAIFHISMFFGVIACYAIIATGLGFRATERVEATIIESPSIDTTSGEKNG